MTNVNENIFNKTWLNNDNDKDKQKQTETKQENLRELKACK